MATVTEGVYRISLVSSGYGDQFLTAVEEQWVALLPADGQWPQQWDIRHCDDGYTIGQANTDTYAVYDDTPDLGEPIPWPPSRAPVPSPTDHSRTPLTSVSLTSAIHR